MDQFSISSGWGTFLVLKSNRAIEKTGFWYSDVNLYYSDKVQEILN